MQQQLNIERDKVAIWRGNPDSLCNKKMLPSSLPQPELAEVSTAKCKTLDCSAPALKPALGAAGNIEANGVTERQVMVVND